MVYIRSIDEKSQFVYTSVILLITISSSDTISLLLYFVCSEAACD